MSDKNSSFQSLGNGTYRVGGVRVNPTTGRYITRESASSGHRASQTPPSATTKRNHRSG